MNKELTNCITHLIVERKVRNLNDFAAQLGRSPSYISDVKAGRRPMTVEFAYQISKVFPDFTVNYLLGKEEDTPSPEDRPAAEAGLGQDAELRAIIRKQQEQIDRLLSIIENKLG